MATIVIHPENITEEQREKVRKEVDSVIQKILEYIGRKEERV